MPQGGAAEWAHCCLTGGHEREKRFLDLFLWICRKTDVKAETTETFLRCSKPSNPENAQVKKRAGLKSQSSSWTGTSGRSGPTLRGEQSSRRNREREGKHLHRIRVWRDEESWKRALRDLSGLKRNKKINQFVPFVPWKQMITKKKLKTGKKATIWGRKWLDRSKIVCSRSSCVYKNVFSFYICFLCYYWISYSTTSVLEKRKKKDKPKSCYVQ